MYFYNKNTQICSLNILIIGMKHDKVSQVTNIIKTTVCYEYNYSPNYNFEKFRIFSIKAIYFLNLYGLSLHRQLVCYIF